MLKYAPLLEQEYRARKRPVGSCWRLDETYVRVRGGWKYLYRAVDKAGATVDLLLRFPRKTAGHHGTPEKVTIDKSGATHRRSKATTRSAKRALKSARSGTSTTSLSKTTEPSNDWRDQRSRSSPSGQPPRRLPVSNSCT